MVNKNLYIRIAFCLFGFMLLLNIVDNFVSYRAEYNIKKFMLYESKYLNFDYTRNYITISSKNNNEESKFGLIFSPGAFIKEDAYLPILSELSKRGIKIYILKSSLFGVGDMSSILLKSNIKNYILVGHSFGGSKLLNYLKQENKYLELVKGVVLLSSYGQNSQNFSGSNIKFISVVGSDDKIINFEKYENYKNNLPSSTKYLYIDGGNHSYFGNYGLQYGDSEGLISRELQQFIVIREILKLLEEI